MVASRMEQKRPHRLLTIILFTLFAIVALGGVYLSVAESPLDFEYSRVNLMKWVQSLEEWGGLGIILLMIIHSFIPFPAEIVAFIAGEFYGVVWGTIYSWVGAMLGAALAFALSRYMGRSFVMSMMTESSRKKMEHWSSTDSATTLLVVRFIPVIAFNLINYAAGLTHVSWWTFLWTTGLGILPLTTFFVYLGESMRGATLVDWIIFGVVAIFVVVMMRMFKKINARKNSQKHPKSFEKFAEDEIRKS